MPSRPPLREGDRLHGRYVVQAALRAGLAGVIDERWEGEDGNTPGASAVLTDQMRAYRGYGAINQFNNLPQGYLTMGLVQNAMVNGSDLPGNAVSATPVLYQSTVVMTPSTTVYIWIQSQVVSGTIVTA